MQNPKQDFIQSWRFVSSLTKDYAQSIPGAAWEFSPHPKFKPLANQIRHVICVRGVHAEALRTGRMDLSKKKSFYSGSLQPAELIAGLELSSKFMEEAIQSIVLDDFKVDVFGDHLSFLEFAGTIIEHESQHHGMWSLYSALAGFPTPQSWVQNWKM